MSLFKKRKPVITPGAKVAPKLPDHRTYGFDGTIHQTTQLDVELDSKGDVVAVWFRCQALPFKQSTARPERAEDMKRMYASGPMPGLLAVEVVDRRA